MSAGEVPNWSAWTQVVPVITGRRTGAPYVRVTLPASIAPDADGGFPDLRVVDEHGVEQPYALDPQRPTAGDRAVALIDVGFVPHRGTQGVVDLGPSDSVVDAVTLDVDQERRPTYFERVAIDASDDRRTWRIVRDDAIVYRVAQDDGRGNTTLTFPPTRSRWLRVRVLDPNRPFPITGATTSSSAAAEPAPMIVGGEPIERDDDTAHEQIWTFAPPVPLRATAVTFADGGAYYERTVSVEASDEGTVWTPIGDGTIAHYAQGGAQATICLTEMTARYVRVRVRNGDDAPVRGLRPTLVARRHTIVFAAGSTDRLLAGNPNARTQIYDLAATLAHEDWRADDAATTAQAANAAYPGYDDQRTIGERYSWLVTPALLGVALVLGLIALRTIPRHE
jgi:hypothetical protein